VAQGYAGTGTADILRAAGVQRGTLYHHFTDKAALLEAVARQLNGEALLAIASACFDAPGAELPIGCLAWLDRLDDPGHRRVWLCDVPAHLEAARQEELAQAGFRGWLEERVADGLAARLIEGALAGLAGSDKALRTPLVRALLTPFSAPAPSPAPAPGNDYLKLLAAARGAASAG
jgi:AcrR family transcriptional regulator